MSMEELVSIITPCYNGERYIKRYAKSLLSQTYHNCQLIFMDDGSTDRSQEMIMSYEDQFRKKGIDLEYHYHDNIGLGGTIAEGIKYVKGSYVIWPDVDDVMTPNSIEYKVDFLKKNPQYGLVRTNYMLARDNPENIIRINGTENYRNLEKENLFEDYLVSKNMWLQPGCYMIRMEAFDKANPDRYIYPTRTGQDWQMLLPVLYYYKCGYIPDSLYIYIINSHSLSQKAKGSFEKEKKQLSNYEEIICETIRHMNITQKQKYIEKVCHYYSQQQLSLGFRYGNRNWVNIQWDKLPLHCKNIKMIYKKIFVGSKQAKNLYDMIYKRIIAKR